MGRAKSRMELIGNEKERRTTFEKRKKGLEKAAYELSTLCGVGIGMIFYDNESNEPKIWPSHEAVARLINSYRSRTNFDSRYRSYDLTAYFNDRRERIQDNIKKLREKTREVKYPKWDDKYNSLSQDELKKFDRMLMAKIDAVKERISLIKGSRNLFTDVFMNSPVQQSAIFVPSNTQQQQPLIYYNTSDALMNPSVQGGSISMPNIIQQQQPLNVWKTSSDIDFRRRAWMILQKNQLSSNG